MASQAPARSMSLRLIHTLTPKGMVRLPGSRSSGSMPATPWAASTRNRPSADCDSTASCKLLTSHLPLRSPAVPRWETAPAGRSPPRGLCGPASQCRKWVYHRGGCAYRPWSEAFSRLRPDERPSQGVEVLIDWLVPGRKENPVARAIWTGSLSFGLVNIPVGLYSATEDKAIRFHQFQEGTNDRIRNKRVNARTGDEVAFSEIVKGYDIGAGEYVIVLPEELEAVEPGPTRTIEIVDFVDLEAIDPIYYKTSYYLAPQGNDAQRAYELLRQAMGTTKKIG